MVGSPDGKMVAVGSETGELVVYDQERGTRVVVSQGRMIKEVRVIVQKLLRLRIASCVAANQSMHGILPDRADDPRHPDWR